MKKAKLEQHLAREECRLEEICNIPDYTDAEEEEIWKCISKLNDDLKVGKENINLLKGRLTRQITSFKETIAKVLDKDTSLAKKKMDAILGARHYNHFHSHSD